jgi:hypothetical protein
MRVQKDLGRVLQVISAGQIVRSLSLTEENQNDPPGKVPPSQILAECGVCEKPVIGQTRGYVLDSSGIDEGTPCVRWMLLECDNKHPILVMQSDWTGDPYEWHWDDPARIYPPWDRELSSLIPEQLRQIRDEARACFRAKAYTAAAVMSGRTLECACALNDIRERNLQQSLAKMKEQKHIDGRLWEWAETLRTVRNAAAHYNSSTITKQDAEDSIAFSEALLDYLYVLTARFEALKKRREKKPASVDPAKETKASTVN